MLSKTITTEEIRNSMFSINGDKVPRSDGYSAHFFKVAWNIVGDDVVRAVSHFFHMRRMLPAFNATSVALIPKSKNPSSIKDFRPISCCSIVYKCITKIMANKLKMFMPMLVSPNQSAL